MNSFDSFAYLAADEVVGMHSVLEASDVLLGEFALGEHVLEVDGGEFLASNVVEIIFFCRDALFCLELLCLSHKLWLMFMRGFSPQKRQKLVQTIALQAVPLFPKHANLQGICLLLFSLTAPGRRPAGTPAVRSPTLSSTRQQ